MEVTQFVSEFGMFCFPNASIITSLLLNQYFPELYEKSIRIVNVAEKQESKNMSGNKFSPHSTNTSAPTLHKQHVAFSVCGLFSVAEADCIPVDAIKINATNVQAAE